MSANRIRMTLQGDVWYAGQQAWTQGINAGCRRFETGWKTSLCLWNFMWIKFQENSAFAGRSPSIHILPPNRQRCNRDVQNPSYM